MGANSKISWTDHTFNPWWGCEKVSPGCAHCYAETLAKRTGFVQWGHGRGRRRTSPANWRQPLTWQRWAERDGTSPRVFCASMADWLDLEVPVEWLADLLDLIARTPDLRWMLLTKRPENWRGRLGAVAALPPSPGRTLAIAWLDDTPPRHVAVGTTVEDQRRAEERIPELLAIPAGVRFLSCEPLLSQVDLRDLRDDELGAPWDGLAPDAIHQVIVGGESGPSARSFDVLWAEDIIDQCQGAGVPVWVKQLGTRPVLGDTGDLHGWPADGGPVDWESGEIRLRTRAGADMSEWPEHLRVREVMP